MRHVLHSVRLRVAAVLAVLGVLALAVAGPNWMLRQKMRAQILAREGRTMLALVDLQRTLELDRLREMKVPAESLDQLVVALQTTRLAGVVALRMQRESDGQLAAFPAGVLEKSFTTAEREAAKAREPVVRFHPKFSLLALFDQVIDDDEVTADCLEVTVPISPPGESLVIAQYWIDGSSITREFAALDRRIWTQALVVWGAVSVLALALLFWAARRLAAAARALERANQELQLAAKSSALGAVTAHLMHGLRNPLAGLRGLARDRSQENGLPTSDDAWGEAVQLADRLHGMVEEVTTLLRDEQAGVQYDVTAAELKAMVVARTQPQLARAGVSLNWELSPVLPIDSRRAGLVSLVLSNLVQNSCEVSRAGAAVVIAWQSADGRHVFQVADQGPGLPAVVRERLFLPVPSGRSGGAGIGLAISRQLAAHAGGDLTLVRSDSAGTVFQLSVPVVLVAPAGSPDV